MTAHEWLRDWEKAGLVLPSRVGKANVSEVALNLDCYAELSELAGRKVGQTRFSPTKSPPRLLIFERTK